MNLSSSHNKKLFVPTIYNLAEKKDLNIVESLIKSKKIIRLVDEYAEQIKELSEVEKVKSNNIVNSFNSGDGVWVYFPWSYSLVHILDKNKYEKVRVSRNKNLITAEEQAKIKKAKIGFAGLNVGNPGAVCMASLGTGNYFKMADFDELSLSNLNRFRASLADLGVNKAIITARQVYEINPFLDIKMFEDGIKLGKEEEFLLKPKLDVLVEETDNLKLKISIREKAQKLRIPVVMVTGNGENLILDVERYDQNPNLPILNGLLDSKLANKIKEADFSKMSLQEKVILARDFIGKNNLTKRLVDSFELVGISLAGIPQISDASFLRGSVLSFAVRQIILGNKLDSGRYKVNLNEIIK